MDERAIEEFTLFGERRADKLRWITKNNSKHVSSPISPNRLLRTKPKNVDFFTPDEKRFFMMGMKSPAKKGTIPNKKDIFVSTYSNSMTISKNIPFFKFLILSLNFFKFQKQII